jgi:hypothetical protein
MDAIEESISLLKELQRKMIMTIHEMNEFLKYDDTPNIKKVMEQKLSSSWDMDLLNALCHPLIKQLEQSGLIGKSEKIGEVIGLNVIVYMLTEKGAEYLKQAE